MMLFIRMKLGNIEPNYQTKQHIGQQKLLKLVMLIWKQLKEQPIMLMSSDMLKKMLQKQLSQLGMPNMKQKMQEKKLMMLQMRLYISKKLLSMLFMRQKKLHILLKRQLIKQMIEEMLLRT